MASLSASRTHSRFSSSKRCSSVERTTLLELGRRQHPVAFLSGEGAAVDAVDGLGYPALASIDNNCEQA